jgi:monoamine oxidase
MKVESGTGMIDVIVVGAGAAGLMSGKILAEAGKNVVILEARDRCGGRIYSVYDKFYGEHRELGAEFIHGKLPLTFQLLSEGDLEADKIAPDMWQADEEGLHEEADFSAHWDELLEKMEHLEEDTNLVDFLNRNFPGEKYEGLRQSAIGYAEGYETADPRRASTIGLREEWKEEMKAPGYRIKGGYGKLMLKLRMDFEKAGGSVRLSSVVKEISWEEGKVKVKCRDGQLYEARQILITVPLGVLQADESSEAYIHFVPSITGHLSAAKQLGYGSIIKLLIEFTERFWESERVEKLAGKKISKIGFILSYNSIPTWWFQHPRSSNLLTGWLGGPKAKVMSGLPEEKILSEAIESLSNIFEMSETELYGLIKNRTVANWTTEAFTLGSYSYATVDNEKYKNVLSTPVDNTIFFAGEALCGDSEAGTVEAALSSGKEAAKKILALK